MGIVTGDWVSTQREACTGHIVKAWNGAVRAAIRSDVPSINAIYNSYILGSHVSFDTTPWSDDERLSWFDERMQGGFAVLVVVVHDQVVGAAWAGPWRGKVAYDRTAETTIILSPDSTCQGIGPVLYATLIGELENRGFHRCYAIIALPNEASVALHEQLGYEIVGVLDEVGYKDGRYISTLLLERRLGAGSSDG